MDFYDKKFRQKLGLPFWSIAKNFCIKIDEKDVEYIINVIKKDKLYPLINKAFMSDVIGLSAAYAEINQIVFYEKFYNSPDCPKGVKTILFTYIGLYRDELEQSHPGLLSRRYAIVERWFETVK